MTTEANPTFIRGACPHDCPDTCATLTEVRDGRAVRFYADKNHPITQGWLCAKVRPYIERVYAPDRLHYPLRRVGPKGSGGWERISWESAIDEIATRWKAIIAEYGAAAILPYSYSGTRHCPWRHRVGRECARRMRTARRRHRRRAHGRGGGAKRIVGAVGTQPAQRQLDDIRRVGRPGRPEHFS